MYIYVNNATIDRHYIVMHQPPTHQPTFICIYAHTHVHTNLDNTFLTRKVYYLFDNPFDRNLCLCCFLNILEGGGRDMERWGRNKNKPRNDSEKVRRTFVCVYNLTHTESAFTHVSVRVSPCDSDLHVHRGKYDD